MTLNDAGSISTIVSAVVVVVTVFVALRALKWAKDSAIAGLDAVKEGKEAGELAKQTAELQRQNLEVAERIQQAASDSVEATKSLLHQQMLMLELTRYEYLHRCVTEIESTVRNQNHLTFNDARNKFQDALDLMAAGELPRCGELTSARVNTAGGFTTNAKNELNEKIRWHRTQLMHLLFASIEPEQVGTPIDA